jgi:ubiquinone/menaquinone biosynthesis C-methylase UbiE
VKFGRVWGADILCYVMSDPPSSWSAFRDLEASGQVDAAARWLEEAAAIAPVHEGKRRSFELLGLTPGDRVLDVGCGTGTDVLWLSKLVSPGGEAIGVDSSPGLVKAARRAVATVSGSARFEVADAVALPFADAAFAACRCDRTLQHLMDPHAALREMARVTRPGGVVLVSEGRNTVAGEASTELPVLDELLGLWQAREERHGWLGFLLPLVLRQVGLEQFAIERVGGELTRADEIAAFYDLDRLSERAVSEKRLTRGQCTELAGQIAAETSTGRLRVEVETYLFAARVAG